MSKGKGKGKHGKKAKAETIGRAAFSIPAGKTATITFKLNGTGRSLLGAAHGHLSASLTVLKSSPAPSQTQRASVGISEGRSSAPSGRGPRFRKAMLASQAWLLAAWWSAKNA